MLYLIKLFLGLCLSAILSGCSFFATVYGSIAYYGYTLYNAPETVNPDIVVEQQIGFATFTGNYDLYKADRRSDKMLLSDDFCVLFGNYAGYSGADGIFQPEATLSVASMDANATRVYQSIWGELHAGHLLGGKNSTDYKGYFVSQVVGLNPADFIKQNDGLIEDKVMYEYFTSRNAALGKDYMLKIFYNTDRTGAIYLYAERDYTLSNAPILDDFAFKDFVPEQSFAIDSAIADYDGTDSGATSLFNVEEYAGAWDSGYVTIDGVDYKLWAENLRALESQGVVPFDSAYVAEGYDTPTKGGKKDIPFVFGHRVLVLKLEFSNAEGAVLRDARVYGFSTELSNNSISDDELAHGSYGIHPTGQAVDEQTFVDTYFGGSPYTVTKQGKTYYYTSDGHEITREQYLVLIGGGSITLEEDTAEEDATTDESTETVSEDTAEESTDEAADETSDESVADAEESDETAEETDGETEEEPAENPGGGDTNTGFAGVGTTSDATQEQLATLDGDWFVIGGLRTEVTLASLDIYLQKYSTGVTQAGSGNTVTYIVTKGTAKMTFVLEKNTTISSMEVLYEGN